MSDQHSPITDQPFNSNELQQFDADDAHAGSAIGKMLALFFLYTVIAMAGSCLATWYWISKSTG